MKQNPKDNSFILRSVMLFGSIVIAFYLGFLSANWYERYRDGRMQVLEQNLDSFSEQNAQLSARVNEADIALTVAKLANERLQENLSEAMKARTELKEELSFYKRIVAPELSNVGFSIDNLEVSPSAINRTYDMQLTLLQQTQRRNPIKGSVSIFIRGEEGDEAKTYALDQLMFTDSVKDFEFKYFTSIDFRFVLPPTFDAETIEVDVQLSKPSQGQTNYLASYDWSSILAPSSGD
ncbi:DUF6776 family protein [Ningiella sp. W23]|uniref:DUF6776 family protein n=1 Tax=Ningiella sp. W23 TaxID=3023715 RepID=UPI003757C082